MKKQIQLLTVIGALSFSVMPVGAVKKPFYGPKINTKGNNQLVIVPVIVKNDQNIVGMKVIPKVKKESGLIDVNGKIKPEYLDNNGNFKTELKKKNKN